MRWQEPPLQNCPPFRALVQQADMQEEDVLVLSIAVEGIFAAVLRDPQFDPRWQIRWNPVAKAGVDSRPEKIDGQC